MNDHYWLLGFAEGDSCFAIKTQKSKNKFGLAVWLRFRITKHTRDERLMQTLIKYFGCIGGYI